MLLHIKFAIVQSTVLAKSSQRHGAADVCVDADTCGSSGPEE